MLKGLNQQSLLMLYLADELSVSDRAHVARMLEADADLRAELAALEAAHRSFEESMAGLDSSSVLAEAGAVRRIGQAMRQHMADQLGKAGKPTIVTHAKSRYPMWVYPSAAAAVVAIGFLIWWGHRAEMPLKIASSHITVPGASSSPTTNLTPDPKSVAVVPTSPSQDSASGSTPVASAEDASQPYVEGPSNNLGEVNLTQPKDSVASLYAAEDEVSELSRSRSQTFGFSLGNE